MTQKRLKITFFDPKMTSNDQFHPKTRQFKKTTLYESFQNSPVPGGLNPKDLPGNRNCPKSRGITVLPSIHGRSPQKSRLGGPAVSLEVRNPNMRESTLTWSESQRQVEIDRREIGEKCPREDRLERLDILTCFDVESIETDLKEYFPEDLLKSGGKSEKIEKIEPENDINSDEEADRILAEKEQEKLFSERKHEILQNSPSRHTGWFFLNVVFWGKIPSNTVV